MRERAVEVVFFLAGYLLGRWANRKQPKVIEHDDPDHLQAQAQEEEEELTTIRLYGRGRMLELPLDWRSHDRTRYAGR